MTGNPQDEAPDKAPDKAQDEAQASARDDVGRDRDRDRSLVRRALELALRGRGHVEPNPRVGALALCAGRVVGEGYHRAFGGAHAEREALADARRNGAERVDEVVVTMEPCSTKRGVAGKKTDPCTDALLEAGVRRVVLGGGDPDPRHDGPGVRLLREAGVEVVTGVLEDECRAINLAFERFLASGRLHPWTIFKSAQSLDGRIATRTGDSKWISSEASRFEVHELRSRCDAIVTGYRTALVDDPRLSVRLPDEHPQASARPLRVVIDPEAALPPTLGLYATAAELPTLAVVRKDAEATRLRALEAAGVEVLLADGAPGAHQVDLASVWEEFGRRGLRRVLLESGGGLAARFLERGLLDQWRIYQAPMILGGDEATSVFGGPGVDRIDEAFRFEELAVRTCGPDLVVDAFTRALRRSRGS